MKIYAIIDKQKIPTLSHALLTGGSRRTLHGVFTYAVFSQEYYHDIGQDFFLCDIILSFSGNIEHDFYMYDVVWEYQDDIAQNFFLFNVACSLSDNTPDGFNLCIVIPRVLWQN